MLDAARDRVRVVRPEVGLDAVDHEYLLRAEHDPELLVLVAGQRDDGAGLELDQVEHRGLPRRAGGRQPRARARTPARRRATRTLAPAPSAEYRARCETPPVAAAEIGVFGG